MRSQAFGHTTSRASTRSWSGVRPAWRRKSTGLEATVGQRFQLATADLDRRFAEERTYLSTSLCAFESRLMRWMFTLWTGTMLALAGMLLAILKLK
jgi:hypothetical protein